MLELPPIVRESLLGFAFGLLFAIPVGPVNMTIINEGARRGFRWALLISLGSIVMEALYCGIAFTGFASFFQNRVIKASMEVFSFVFMLYLGLKFVTAKTVSAPMHLSARVDKIEEQIEEKLHPHSAFMIGFVRTMANPGVLLFWIILSANLMSRDWVEATVRSRVTFVTAVSLGIGLWFAGLSWAVSLGHRKFSEKTLLRMERISGVGLLGLAIIHGANIAYQLAKHKM
jgi:threonine/homoserine/homoserine lactone efflux protein